MAIYHLSAKVISRADGRSAVAAAAYRAAEELHDERLGRAHDFTNKAGVIHSEILLPEGAPARLADRTTLVERGGGHGEAEGRAACPRDRDCPAAGADPGAGDRSGAGFRARAVRGAGDGGGPQCALGPHGERRGPAARACHADDAGGWAGRVRQEGAGLEPHRGAGGLAGTLGGAGERTPGRAWARHPGGSPLARGAGHRAGAAEQDRAGRGAARSAGRGRRAGGGA